MITEQELDDLLDSAQPANEPTYALCFSFVGHGPYLEDDWYCPDLPWPFSHPVSLRLL